MRHYFNVIANTRFEDILRKHILSDGCLDWLPVRKDPLRNSSTRSLK